MANSPVPASIQSVIDAYEDAGRKLLELSVQFDAAYAELRRIATASQARTKVLNEARQRLIADHNPEGVRILGQMLDGK